MALSIEQQINLAKEFARQKHEGQTDRAGVSYFDGHVCTVASRVKTDKAIVVAYLHDVLEDTDATSMDLISLGFDDDIIQAVEAITKDYGISYKAYIERVAANKLAREVKIADISHNSELARLPRITKKDVERNIKYMNALMTLLEIDNDIIS